MKLLDDEQALIADILDEFQTFVKVERKLLHVNICERITESVYGEAETVFYAYPESDIHGTYKGYFGSGMYKKRIDALKGLQQKVQRRVENDL